MDSNTQILQSLKLTSIGDPFCLTMTAGTVKGEHPFIGLITYAGKSSDNCVGGTELIEGGPYRVYIPADVMRKKIRDLEGCSVFAENNLDSHSKTKPIGEFTSAWVEPADTAKGGIVLAARASGLLSHSKNPGMVDKIVAEAREKRLGFSYDIKDIYFTLEAHEVLPNVKIVKVLDFQWRGATILYNDVAAYGLTELAAREKMVNAIVPVDRIREAILLSVAEGLKNKPLEVDIMNEEQLKQLKDLVANAVTDAIKPIEDNVKKVSDEVSNLKKETSELKAKAEKKPEAKAETKTNDKPDGDSFTVNDLVDGIGAKFEAALKPLTDAVNKVLEADKPKDKEPDKANTATAQTTEPDKKETGNTRKTMGYEEIKFAARWLPEEYSDTAEELTPEAVRAMSAAIAADKNLSKADKDAAISKLVTIKQKLIKEQAR